MRAKRIWLLLSLVVAAGTVLAVLARQRSSADGPRLVLLYATCTVNRDYLGPYNPTVQYTPNLDRFAARSVVFENQQTEAGQSGIAYASLFSGQQAPRHGVFEHPTVLTDDLLLIGEAFRAAGYDPHFWARQAMASPELNYGQGVPADNVRWDPQAGERDTTNVLTADDADFRAILDRLEDDSGYRALLLTNFSQTHAPYSALPVNEFCKKFPAECTGPTPAERIHWITKLRSNRLLLSHFFAKARDDLQLSDQDVADIARSAEIFYKANIYQLDRMFGAVVDEIEARGLLDDALVAFTADHGEVQYRANADVQWNHGPSLAREVLLVPWLLHAPGIAPGRYRAVSRSIDVFPTLAGLAGIALDAEVAGVDLAPALRGTQPAPELLAFSHTGLNKFLVPNPTGIRVAVRSGDRIYKLVEEDGASRRAEVFDWNADPGELRDLFDGDDPRDTALVESLSAYKRELVESHGHWEALRAGRIPSERALEILRSLGYLPESDD